jgi:hypothetical protein
MNNGPDRCLTDLAKSSPWIYNQED